MKNYKPVLTEKDKSEVIEELERASYFDFHLFSLVILSATIATFGLLRDDVAVVIGGMLMNPLVHPFLGLSAGVVIREKGLILRSLVSSVAGVFFQFLVSFSIAFWLQPEITEQILSRAILDHGNIILAVGSGVVAAMAMVSPGNQDKLIGAGIAIALLPPISVAGIGLALGRMEITEISAKLALINMLALVLSSLVIFSLVSLKRKKEFSLWKKA